MQVLWFSFAICCSLLIGLAASLPTATTQTDHVTDSSNSEVPREFPKLTQNYTFVDNSSIRENLVSHADSDTEVEDLLEDIKEEPNLPDLVPPVPSEVEEDAGRKSDVEWIENGDDTEDTKFTSTEASKDSTTKTETSTAETTTSTEKKIVTSTATTEQSTSTATTEPSTSTKGTLVTDIKTEKVPSTTSEKAEAYRAGVPLLDGTVGAILVGVFLVVCIGGYTLLLLWRRSLELRYGSREMLVDKDDMYDPDDLRHFSI